MGNSKVTKLSSQQINFCEELASGKSQREAYNIAYPSFKRTHITSDVMASRLISKDKVFSYYQSLLKKSAQKCQITRDEILDKYKEIYNSQPDGMIVKNSDRLKALELTSKMLGLNEPDKLDINGSIDNNLTVEIIRTVRNASTD